MITNYIVPELAQDSIIIFTGFFGQQCQRFATKFTLRRTQEKSRKTHTHTQQVCSFICSGLFVVHGTCAGENAALASPTTKAPANKNDQGETQPVDVMSIPEPECPTALISPEHSAAQKRQVFQSKGAKPKEEESCDPGPTEAEIPQEKPKKADDHKGEFTESDTEAGHISHQLFKDVLQP